MRRVEDGAGTPVQKILFPEATKIVKELITVVDNRSQPVLQKVLIANGTISQVDFLSFFGKIVDLFACHMIVGMKDNMDQCNDSEVTHQTIFEDLKNAIAIRLGLNSEKPPLPNGIKRL